MQNNEQKINISPDLTEGGTSVKSASLLLSLFPALQNCESLKTNLQCVCQWVSMLEKKRASQKFSFQGRQKYVASALIASIVDGSDVHFRALCFYFVMPFSSAASADPRFGPRVKRGICFNGKV